MIAVDARPPADFLAGAGQMGTLIRQFDWAGTPLGRIESWPQSLKTSVSLILTSRHPMWIGWGPEMTFLYNDAYLHVLGPAKHPRALGRPASEVWAEIWDICGPLADNVFQRGEASFVDDVRLFMDRGDFREETFYSFSYSPIRDESGQVSGLFCPSTDVTAKVLNARRLRTLSELATSALVEKTAAGACAILVRTLAKNPDDIPFALLYLTGDEGRSVFLEQVVGSVENRLARAERVQLESALEPTPWSLQAVFQTCKRQVVSISHLSGFPGVAGQRVTQAVVLPITSRGEQKPYGVLVAGVNPCRPLDADHIAFFDLLASEAASAIQNARAVEEEKKRADMLAELDRAKTAFFSNVSHEFRTPLTLMLGPLESLLLKQDLQPDEQENLAIAHRNSLRLLKLVNSLLDFSRIEAGRIQASYAPVDLAQVTADLASNFRSAMQAAGLQFVVDCPPLPELVYVDREMWEKIVLNLLSNAFKFTFEGRVTVRVRPTDGHAVLTVSDTGTGIPEAELPRIFERFRRIEGAKARTYEGAGIGLALVQELVKLHGGTITASSRSGEGSTFEVAIPLGAAHLPRERVEPAAGPTRGPSAVQAYAGEALTWLPQAAIEAKRPSEAAVKGRVLIADDNADMRDYVTRILGEDYELRVASDGHRALELIRQDSPDLVLTDVMMPRMDGFELLRALRANPATATLPVIFMSARAGEEKQVEGLQAGADDYLIKPFTANELRARVGAHVRMELARRDAADKEAALRAEAEAARDEIVRVLESVHEGFIAFDQDWRITYVNAEAERLNGMRREDMMGRNHWELFPATNGTTVHRELLRAAAERVPVEFENYYDPWRRWFHVKAYPGPDGGVSLFYEDITARKQAEEERKLAERATLLLGAIVESSDDAIVSKDLTGIITSWNKGAERLFGYTAEEVIGKSITIIIPPDRLAEEPEILSRLQRGQRVDHFETIRRRKDGTLLNISLTISPVRDAQGTVIGASKIARDISERKRSEEAIRTLNARLTADLLAMTRLQAVSTRLVQADDFEVLLGEILDAAMAITQADMGNVQLFEDDALRIVSQRGFDAPFLDFFNAVHHGYGTCGTALERGERVVVEDVATSPIFAGTPALEVILGTGACAVQSTPLTSRSGQVLGVFSTYYRVKRRPDERELRMLDLLARQAADLIERRRAEAALLASESKFRQLADSMPQMVWTTRPDGYVDYYNERWYDFTGFDREQLGDLSWKSLLHPNDAEPAYERWYASVRTGQPFRMECRFWDRYEKRWRWFMGRALAVRAENGDIVKWFGTCTDIDEQKRAEDELRRANHDLEQFAYSASHDLQEPLRGVKIYSELLGKRYASRLDGQALEFLNFLRGSASRMELLVRDLLAYTQVTRLEVPDRDADANEAFRETLANLVGSIVESGARVSSDPLPAVRMHEMHLRQLFQNLIGNAIKYRSPERPPEVHVSVERRDGNWRFFVSDNGIGIEPQYKERIFGLFKRLHSGDEYTGTGIGLAICQRIVERYHGRIWVESEPGQGSKFLFTVPF
jgi:PAS domain S-box-containing protein